VAAWLADFTRRLTHLGQLLSGENTSLAPPKRKYWLGGFFNPEGFVTATRQYVAQANNWSLEELILVVDVGAQQQEGAGADGAEGDEGVAFLIEGLSLEGASWETSPDGRSALSLSSEAKARLPLTLFKWLRRSPTKGGAGEGAGRNPLAMPMPVYLHSGRTSLVVEVELKRPEFITESAFRQRAVALIACNFS